MKTDTFEKTATCAACRYWRNDAKGKEGQCRRHAPQMLVFNVDDDLKFKSHFPATAASDWCGDFELQ